MTKPPRHLHLTRDIKPRGECPACDMCWKIMDDAESAARRRREHNSKGA